MTDDRYLRAAQGNDPKGGDQTRENIEAINPTRWIKMPGIGDRKTTEGGMDWKLKNGNKERNGNVRAVVHPMSFSSWA